MNATEIAKLESFCRTVENEISKLIDQGVKEAFLVAVLCRLIHYHCLHTAEPDDTHKHVLDYMRLTWDSSKETLAEARRILSNESS